MACDKRSRRREWQGRAFTLSGREYQDRTAPSSSLDNKCCAPSEGKKRILSQIHWHRRLPSSPAKRTLFRLTRTHHSPYRQSIASCDQRSFILIPRMDCSDNTSYRSLDANCRPYNGYDDRREEDITSDAPSSSITCTHCQHLFFLFPCLFVSPSIAASLPVMHH